MVADRKRIFIDGKEYASINEVPPQLRAQVEQQMQGIDAARSAPSSLRRQTRVSGRGGPRGDGSSGAGFLVLAAVGVALLALLLYFIGR